MPVEKAVVLTMSNEHPEVVLADAEYFTKRARHCAQLAGQTRDPKAAVALRSLAAAFEAKSQSLAKHE